MIRFRTGLRQLLFCKRFPVIFFRTLCYIFGFGVVLASITLTLTLSLNANTTIQRQLLRRDLAQSTRSTVTQNAQSFQVLNAILANITGEIHDHRVAIKVLRALLDRFEDKDELIQQSYVEAVLASNNLTLPMPLAALCQNVSDKHKNDNVFLGYNEFKLPEESKKPSIGALVVADNSKQDPRHTSDPKLKETGLLNKTAEATTTPLPSCLDYQRSLVGAIKHLDNEKSPEQLAAMFPHIQAGGHYRPTDCRASERTAIIIPYRNRHSHLHVLLLNLLPLLVRQKIDFTIFVIEQLLPSPFNRGMLFNVGYLEAMKLQNYDCFIFHDVDLIPINDMNSYRCHYAPTHLIAGVDKYKYKLLYPKMFGGIVAFSRDVFRKINGASNLYFGWGGEDDDLQVRVTNKKLPLLRSHASVGLYDMIKHQRDTKNEVNPVRGPLLKKAAQRQVVEGLNSAVYHTVSVEKLPLYTWVKVNIDMQEVIKTAPTYMRAQTSRLLRVFNSMNTTTDKPLDRRNMTLDTGAKHGVKGMGVQLPSKENNVTQDTTQKKDRAL